MISSVVQSMTLFAEPYLINTHFSDITDVSQPEMNQVINFLVSENTKRGDAAPIPKFYVYRFEQEDTYELVSIFFNFFHFLYIFFDSSIN